MIQDDARKWLHRGHGGGTEVTETGGMATKRHKKTQELDEFRRWEGGAMRHVARERATHVTSTLTMINDDAAFRIPFL